MVCDVGYVGLSLRAENRAKAPGISVVLDAGVWVRVRGGGSDAFGTAVRR